MILQFLEVAHHTDYYMYGISSSGYVMCYQVQDYDGNDFAVSNQECSTGQVMKGITSNGLVICVTDVDTSFAGQCSTGLVMRGVSSKWLSNMYLRF